MFKSSNKAISVLGIAAVLLAGCSEQVTEKETVSEPVVKKESKIAAPKKKVQKNKKLGAKRKAALPVRKPEKSSFDKLNPKLISRLAQTAVDRNDMKKLSEFAARALNSENPEVRRIVVEALGWFQDKALPDLILFMNDEDAEVSSAALRLVDLHLDSIKKDRNKADVIEAALPYATDGMVDAIISKFDNMDKMRSFPRIMSLMDDYEDDPVVMDALIRQYEFISGEKFTTRYQAAKWFSKQ